MPKIETSTLLRLHRQAYEVLLVVGRKVNDDPELLSRETVRGMTNFDFASRWLKSKRSEFPEHAWPEPERFEPFVRLFMSFFATSFVVDERYFDGELKEAYLRVRYNSLRSSKVSRNRLISRAIVKIIGEEGIHLLPEEAGRLAKSKDIHTEVRLLTYVVELERRAFGKSRGDIVHQIWKELPRELRTQLNENVYWLAKEKVRAKAEALLMESAE